MIPVRQSTAFEAPIGPVLDADGVAVTDCVVGDLKIKKTTGNFAALNGSATLTHVSAGTYDLVLTTSDVDTVGLTTIAIDDTVNACAPLHLQVVEEAVYDALFAASALGYVANAPVNVAQISGDSGAADNLESRFDGTGYIEYNENGGRIWYVAASGGNDSNPGTRALPLATIQAGLDALVPNDTLILKAGDYTNDGSDWLMVVETPNVTILGEGIDVTNLETTHFDGCVSIDAKGVRMAGLTAHNENDGSIGIHVTGEDCDLSYLKATAIETGLIINADRCTARHCYFEGGRSGIRAVNKNFLIDQCSANGNGTFDLVANVIFSGLTAKASGVIRNTYIGNIYVSGTTDQNVMGLALRLEEADVRVDNCTIEVLNAAAGITGKVIGVGFEDGSNNYSVTLTGGSVKSASAAATAVYDIDASISGTKCNVDGFRYDRSKVNGASNIFEKPTCGTGTNQIDSTSGVVKSNLAQILGTALTETSGQIAAAFKKFFDKATPTGTINSLPDAAPNANGGLPILSSSGTTLGYTVTTTTTLTNAPSDSSGVTTLLSRVPSGIFTGITSLAQWLGLIAGKQTGNSTARTELRATGAGSGTYDETTDSGEAIRDNQQTAAAAALTAYDPPTRTEATADKDEIITLIDTAAEDVIPTAEENAAAVAAETTIAAGLATIGRIDRASNTIIEGTVGSSSTTTSIEVSSISPAPTAADQFKGLVLKFSKATTTTALRGQATDITANDTGSTPTLTVTALTTAPASGDIFVIE